MNYLKKTILLFACLAFSLVAKASFEDECVVTIRITPPDNVGSVFTYELQDYDKKITQRIDSHGGYSKTFLAKKGSTFSISYSFGNNSSGVRPFYCES